MQLSGIIGKPVITPHGNTCGYVLGATLTRGGERLAALVVADEEEEEYYLPVRNVRSWGDAVVAVGGKDAAPQGIPSPVGREVFTAEGDRLGYVSDLILREEGSVLVLSEAQKHATVPVSFASLGEKIVLFRDPAQKEAARRACGGTRRPAQKRTKKAQSSEDLPSCVQNVPSERGLLGKVVLREVADRHGVVLAKTGDTVTCPMLSLARRKNCLLKLFLATLS